MQADENVQAGENVQADENIRLKVQQHVDGINNEKNLHRVGELLAPDFIEYIGASEQRGSEQFVAKLASMYKNIPDAHITVEDAITQGDKTVYRWSLAGTYQGPNSLGRVAGQLERHSGATVLHIVDGKVQEMRNYVLIPPAKGANLKISMEFTRR